MRPASRSRSRLREQLVHRHVGDDLDLVFAAARRAGQKRSGGAGVNVVPVRTAGPTARASDSGTAASGSRIGDSSNARAFALRQPVIPSPSRSARRRSGSDAPACRIAAAMPRSENAGSIASRNGRARVAPSPRSTVRRGNDSGQERHYFVIPALAAYLFEIRDPGRSVGTARQSRFTARCRHFTFC